MPRSSRDLLALVGLGVAGLVVWLLLPATGLSAGLRALIWLPLAACGPGYALTAALFPRTEVGRAERLLLSVGLSFATLILGAIALAQLGVTLTLDVWAALVETVVSAGCLIALLRRSSDGAPRAPLPRLTQRQWVFFGLAGLLGLTALALAGTPLAATNVQGYTAFWMLPAGDADAPQLQLGAESAELTIVSYRVEVSVGTGSAGEVARLTLAPGEKWEATYAIPEALRGQGVIAARLYRLDVPDEVYRQVLLWP